MQPRFKFGIEVPRSVKEAMRLDKINENNLWMEAVTKERCQLFDYETFEVIPKGEKTPKRHKRILGFFVFDVKHDIRRKARFVVGGHVTIAPKEDNYSEVTSDS